MREQQDDGETDYPAMLVETAGREAVRAAEEIAGVAWMAALAEAEEESAITEEACLRSRDLAYQVFKGNGAGAGTAEAPASPRNDLASAQLALTRIRNRRSLMRSFAERERLAADAAAEARRLEAGLDQDLLTAAARAARPRRKPASDHGERPKDG